MLWYFFTEPSFKFVKLNLTGKGSKTEKRTEKQILAKELKELLSSIEGHRLPVATVLPRYHQHFGRLLKISDYGARCIEELVEDLPSLQVGIFAASREMCHLLR